MPTQPSPAPSTPVTSPERPWWWTAAAPARNAFVLFRRELALASAPTRAELQVMADARYRLWVNEVVVGTGPVRFVPAHPCEDVYDLAPWLRAGANAIVVEVWAPGASTYQTMPEARGGFAPAGVVAVDGAEHDLADEWRCRVGTAWDPEAPAFSFAQGPVEICDTALLPASWYAADADAGGGWSEPSAVSDGPWGPIGPRPLPPLAATIDAPATLSLAAPLADDERRVGCRVFVPGFKKGRDGQRRFPYAVGIHSPRDQAVELGLFWGPHWLNGSELATAQDAVRGNRQNATAALRAGWNLLYGEPEQLGECWAMVVAWPHAAGLRIAASADDDAPEAMRYAAAVPADAVPSATAAVPADFAQLEALGLDWQLAPTTASNTTPHPARDCAWDRPGEAKASEVAADFPRELVGDQVLVYDFCREFLGTVTIELEAPAGTVVDVANDERLRADGLLGLYQTNPFTDTADRFVCRGGRQTISGFHPRGGRWLQLAIRPPAGSTVTLHRVAVTSAQVPVRRDGRFESSEPIFDWTFEAGLATLRACVEDAFLDCPWRERGTYLGDALVEGSALAAVTRDLAVTRRSLELWAQGQLPDGQMQACVPSWHRRPHEDFSLWWIPALRDYWALSGDVEFVSAYSAVIAGIFASPTWDERDDSLWNAEGLHCFVDWGATRGSTQGRGNACLNAIRVIARDAAAELASALGRDDEAGIHRAEAERVRADLRRHLWLADEERFAARLDDDGRPDRAECARHANALLILAGVPAAAQLAGTWRWLEAELAHNLADGCNHGQRQGHCELYFLYYVLRACYAHDRVALAEGLMREHWGLLMRGGAWTLWECFCRGVHGTGSQCHAWSCGPLAMYREQILGVTWPPGDPSRVTVAPNSHLTWARGSVPHPAGSIEVHWRRHADKLFVTATAPAGVELAVTAGPACADLELIRE